MIQFFFSTFVIIILLNVEIRFMIERRFLTVYNYRVLRFLNIISGSTVLFYTHDHESIVEYIKGFVDKCLEIVDTYHDDQISKDFYHCGLRDSKHFHDDILQLSFLENNVKIVYGENALLFPLQAHDEILDVVLLPKVGN